MTTRGELDRFILATTEPRNTGASEAACRIVRMIFEHDGLLRVAVDDKENNAGFIAHLCRRVTQELELISADQTRDRIFDPLLEIVEEAERKAADEKLKPGDRVICEGSQYILTEKNPKNTAEWYAKKPCAVTALTYILHNCACKRVDAF